MLSLQSHGARQRARILIRGSGAFEEILLRATAALCDPPCRQGLGIPPVPFEDLVEAVAPQEIRALIAELLALKRNTGELGYGDPVPEINGFIEAELERHGLQFSGQGRPDLYDAAQIRKELNVVFRTAVREGAVDRS